MTSDPFDLHRFVAAQADVHTTVLAELRAGRKRSHWMWFVFPQIAGLGTSAMSRRYALRSIEEAAAYAAHPVLGPRLVECTGLIVAASPKSLADVLGWPDDVKFHSCVTLFALIEQHDPVFDAALKAFFDAEGDASTIALAS